MRKYKVDYVTISANNTKVSKTIEFDVTRASRNWEEKVREELDTDMPIKVVSVTDITPKEQKKHKMDCVTYIGFDENFEVVQGSIMVERRCGVNQINKMLNEICSGARMIKREHADIV